VNKSQLNYGALLVTNLIRAQCKSFVLSPIRSLFCSLKFHAILILPAFDAKLFVQCRKKEEKNYYY